VLALPVLRLKPERTKSASAGHPWLFSGAFVALPDLEPGSLCRIEDDAGKFVAIGYVNPKRSLAVRLLSWREIDSVQTLLEQRIDAALELRRSIVPPDTDAYRVVNSEGDLLPGLVVDRYADVLVLQLQTAGMERLRDRVVEILCSRLHPRSVYERNDIPVRREEELPMRKGLVAGEPLAEEIEIVENNLRYGVQPEHGQKTGFFLDQRDNRARVRARAKGRRVLNCFAYTGAFGVAACAGGAAAVTSVETSATALPLLRRNFERNAMPPGEVLDRDVFDVLRDLRRTKGPYDLVVLDPPAFAKKKHQLATALRGYKEINRQALELLPPGGELFTFSCSQYVDTTEFRRMVFAAAAEAGAPVQVLDRLGAAADHPVALAHAEGEYLKGLHLRRL